MRGTIHARKTIRGSIGYPTLKGDPGEDGYSPQASVTKNGNTATITITDKSGTTTAQVTDGAKGDPGQDGVSPSATVAQTSSGATITVTDKTGTTTATVTNGRDGDDGYSPSASVSKSGRVATIAVTDKTGTTTVQVSDGQDGTPAIIDATPTEDSPNAVSSGGVYDELTSVKSDLQQLDNDKYEKPSTGIPASDIASGVIPDVPVTDVQVNGTSVLSDGVANVPVASANEYGAVKVNPGSTGIGLSSSGVLILAKANEAQIKASTNFLLPFTVSNQHIATFYGLAKAAGDTTQSASSNAVGTYTDDAKIKIQKMLGIYEAPWELIREDTFTNATEADHVITVDGNGDSFELTDVILLFDLPNVSEASSKTNDKFTFRFYAAGTGNIEITTSGGTMSRNANGSAVGTWQVIEQRNGMIFVQQGQKATSTNGCAVSYRYHATNSAGNGVYLVPEIPFYCVKIIIPAVTGTGHYKLYGKRKWS